MAEQTHKINFLDYHLPDMDDGDYKISVTQTIEAKNQLLPKQNFSTTFPTKTLKFSILGPRFTLDPQLLEGVFPPAGSLGDHAHVLPHILLNRSTLPWERKAIIIKPNDSKELQAKKKNLPWLALLLFDESESPTNPQVSSAVKMSTVSASDLKATKTGEINWPGITLETGQHDDDPLTVIDVRCSLLKQIMPSADDLPFLAHVRLTEDELAKPGEGELAVIIGNRLPKSGSNSVVHLVSIEGRYTDEADKMVFNFGSVNDNQFIRLVSLKNWRFACTDETGGNFTDLAKSLKPKIAVLRLPPLEKKFNDTEEDLKKGCVLLPHAMRQGNKSASWYRGPLVPGNNTGQHFDLPIRAADDLVSYNDQTGVFDISYAAAWELGRLLALQSKPFSVSLYNWKRYRARSKKDCTNSDERQLAHLPFSGPSPNLELPEMVSSWFEHLMLLEGIPFHYLVPDERMLPLESIRFFQVDPVWMECLLDGAFSIGRVSQCDHEQDRSNRETASVPSLPHRVSGFLLRSDMVAGWPGLLVEGYDKAIASEGFTPEKELQFEVLSLPSEMVLNDDCIKKIYDEFVAHKVVLSTLDNLLFEQQGWLIKNGDGEFKLLKRENNQIDVCSTSAADKQYLFSLDAAFEADLIGSKLSPEFLAIFQAKKLTLQHDSKVYLQALFITDTDNQTHYLIEKERQTYKVFRSFKLPLLRMARLSTNILICLFEGVVKTVDLHLKPETLHFGLDKNKDGFIKKLRSLKDTNAYISDPFQEGNEDLRVINAKKLAQQMADKLKAESTLPSTNQPFTTAKFAYEMIASAEKVRFYFADS